MGKDFTTALRPAVVMTLLFALLLGLAYPLAMTGIGQAIFPAEANGSLVRDTSGKVIGSTVVGQAFTSEQYFQTRPSAAGKGYDGLASSGSNLGPASQALVDRIKPDIQKRRADALTAPRGPDKKLADEPLLLRHHRLPVHVAVTDEPSAVFGDEERMPVARRDDLDILPYSF